MSKLSIGDSHRAPYGISTRALASRLDVAPSTVSTRGLGFPRIDSPPSVAFFTLNGSWLGLFGHDDLAEDATVSPRGEGFKGVTLAHNVDSDQAIDAIIEQAVTAGAVLVKKPQKVFWGGYSGYFADPDGHLWEIAHNPLFWVGPKDGGT